MIMNSVAKLVIIDGSGKHLLLYRSAHPAFGDDPDLPGGTLEEGESVRETMVREVDEELGVAIDEADIREIYAGADYSRGETHYSLFIAEVSSRPQITLSWEHSSYEWIDRDSFLEKAKGANDTYMHMVYSVLSQ
jgi:8-oxo-dGTP pyrophosphatase MutT (NUDIX family)